MIRKQVTAGHERTGFLYFYFFTLELLKLISLKLHCIIYFLLLGAILSAAAPYYQPPVVPQDVQPDRPIGYGAFGVVW